MQGVMGAAKIEKRFWNDMPSANPSPVLADQWCMNYISKILSDQGNSLALAQVVEVHRAWKNIKNVISNGGIPTLRIVLD